VGTSFERLGDAYDMAALPAGAVAALASADGDFGFDPGMCKDDTSPPAPAAAYAAANALEAEVAAVSATDAATAADARMARSGGIGSPVVLQPPPGSVDWGDIWSELELAAGREARCTIEPQTVTEAADAVRLLCAQMRVPRHTQAQLLGAEGVGGGSGGEALPPQSAASLARLNRLGRQLRELRGVTIAVLRLLRRRAELRAECSRGAAPGGASLAALLRCEQDLEHVLLPQWASLVPSMPFVFEGHVFPQQLILDRKALVARLVHGANPR